MALKLSRLITLRTARSCVSSSNLSSSSSSSSETTFFNILPTLSSSGASSKVSLSTPSSTPQLNRQFSTSKINESLMDFFDDQANWSKDKIKTGRPWKLEELRIKSNEDLHKLWYLLLREVNMLLTMEEEFRRLQRNFPAPERLDKCEESMENIMQVMKERDEAYNMLETGVKSSTKKEWRYDELGRPFVYERREHLLPEHLNEDYQPNPMGYEEDNEFWIWVHREKELREKYYWQNMELKHKRKLKDIWPENEVLKEVPDPRPYEEDFTAGDQPSATSQSGASNVNSGVSANYKPMDS